MKKSYQMYLVLGDWSDDGHCQKEKRLVTTNYPVARVQQAYKDSCKLTGMQFNHNENYTNDKKPINLFTEYGDNRISKENLSVLKKFFSEEQLNNFFVIDEEDEDKGYFLNDFLPLWFEFTKLSLSDLSYSEEKKEDTIPYINGYWNNDLNVQFAYGLYD